jgi:hypothetical protein
MRHELAYSAIGFEPVSYNSISGNNIRVSSNEETSSADRQSRARTLAWRKEEEGGMVRERDCD